MSTTQGIHHVTAIAGDPQRNIDFYAGVLGLRLVKRTVNFDDPETYHFYFGDEVGTPGSLITFFPWPGARPGRPGSGQVVVVSFAVVPGALGFWLERLLRHGVNYRGPTKHGAGPAAEQVIAFTDPDGLALEIVAHPGAAARPAWGGTSGVSREQAIHGFHSVGIWVETDDTEHLLTKTLGFELVDEVDGARRVGAGDRGVGTLANVRAVGDFPRGVGGPGTVHHVAWRVADDATQLVLRDAVIAAGLEPTPVIDRTYFRSVYFREPGGVLFELATEGPGFMVDEPVGRLGEKLQLPARLESRRLALEAVLPPVHLPSPERAPRRPEDVSGDVLGYIHNYFPPDRGSEFASSTLLLLHGTGGNEDDLVPLGRALLPGAAILSPRGNVLEDGAPRFFRRLAEGVFDQTDLEHRTEELSHFIEAALRLYDLDRDGMVAVGFSNGANIAASLLLRRPGELRAAILLSPMLPYEPDTQPDLAGTAVFIGAAKADRIAPTAQIERLADVLRQAGADVTLHWEPPSAGHSVTPAEIDAARRWLTATIHERSTR